jgi:hypothetical protein
MASLALSLAPEQDREYVRVMPARQPEGVKVFFRADEFDVIAKELGLITDAEKAAYLSTSAANFSRIRNGRSVGALFMFGVLTVLPKVDLHRLFEVATEESRNQEAA